MRAGLATVISGIPLREYEPLIRDFEEVDTYAMCVGESAIETFADRKSTRLNSSHT